MAVTLINIDNVPIENEDFSDEFKIWLTHLIDTLNTNIALIQSELTSVDARLTAGGL